MILCAAGAPLGFFARVVVENGDETGRVPIARLIIQQSMRKGKGKGKKEKETTQIKTSLSYTSFLLPYSRLGGYTRCWNYGPFWASV